MKKIRLSYLLTASLIALASSSAVRESRAQAGEPWSTDGIATTSLADFEKHLIHDDTGRTAYIIELRRGAADGYSKKFGTEQRFAAYQRGEVVNLVQAMEVEYGFRATTMTSWIGSSFTAFLDGAEYSKLARDPRVEALLPDVNVTFSTDTTAVWTDSAQTLAAPPNSLWTARVSQASEMQPWGKRAVNQATTTSNGSAVVYVVDAGVGQHQDLNVVEWVNTINHANDCGTRAGVTPALAACTTAKLSKLVGCYTHSTAVAGIIGARSNGSGVIGIDPGVKIVSVSILDPAAYPNTPSSTCLDIAMAVGATIQSSLVKTALDWVASDIATNNHSGKPSVVNLSINWGEADQWPVSGISAVKADMAAIASASPGAFVVQSAGNQFGNACTYAYGPTSTNDGVMVVGAINNHGQPVVPLNGANGFWKDLSEPAGKLGHEPGSNFGTCVEAWAPGDAIFTTMGPAVAQQGGTVYSTYAYGSGTSFSAPHVAGLAAYLIETLALTTPSQVETSVRSKFSSLGSLDPSGLAIKLPTMNPLPANVSHNTPYAEFVLGRVCLWPSFASGTPPASCHVLSADDPSDYTDLARNMSTLSLIGKPNVWMAFDSYGTGTYSCDVQINHAQAGSTTLFNGKHYYNTGIASAQIVNAFALSSQCPSASIFVSP